MIKKIANPNKDTVDIVVTVTRPDNYKGYDVYPDVMIGDLLVALGRHFSRKFKERSIYGKRRNNK